MLRLSTTSWCCHLVAALRLKELPHPANMMDLTERGPRKEKPTLPKVTTIFLSKVQGCEIAASHNCCEHISAICQEIKMESRAESIHANTHWCLITACIIVWSKGQSAMIIRTFTTFKVCTVTPSPPYLVYLTFHTLSVFF